MTNEGRLSHRSQMKLSAACYELGVANERPFRSEIRSMSIYHISLNCHFSWQYAALNS